MNWSRAMWTRLEGHVELHGMSKQLQGEFISMVHEFISEADTANVLSYEVEKGEDLLRRALKETME